MQPYLYNSGALRKGAIRHITNKTTVHITTPRVLLNSAEYGTFAKQLLLRLTTTSNSHCLFPAARCRLSKQGGYANTNATHRTANCPRGGRNCPRIPLTIPRPNYPTTSPHCTSTHSLTGVHASAPIARITTHRILKIVSPHSSRRMPCSRQIC